MRMMPIQRLMFTSRDDVWNPRFISCDYLVQKIITLLVITLQKRQSSTHMPALVLFSEHVWHPSCTNFSAVEMLHNLKKKNLRGFGPLANYADWTTAASWRSSANFWGQRVLRGQRNESPGRILGFLDRSRYYFFQVAPQLYSRVLTRLSGPRSRPTASQKIWKCRKSNPGPLDL
jgi:hypothetical protein